MKRRSLRILAFCTALVIAFASFFQYVGTTPVRTHAATTLEKLQKAKEEKKKTEGNIKNAKNTISNLEGIHQDLIDELNSLNDSLMEVNENLELLEEAITIVEDNIETTKSELADAENQRETQYYRMSMRVRYIYERGELDFIGMLFSADSFADFLNAVEYINSVVRYDREQLENYKQLCADIEQKKADLEAEEDELNGYQLLALAEQDRVMSLITQTATVVAQYEDEIESAEAQLAAYQDTLDQQNKDVAALQKQYEQELALSQAALKAKWRDISEVTWAEGDRYLLANLIYCEAGGEPYAGQVAVGSVVVNRLLSSKFPNTLTGVVYSPRQFSPVSNGRLAIALAKNKATANCYKAADEAMSGYTNVEQCLFFRTPIAGITPKYAIGGHIFY